MPSHQLIPNTTGPAVADVASSTSLRPKAQRYSEKCPASTLACAPASSEAGHFSEYRWAFGLNDVLLAIGYTGPVVLGINWWEGMYSPDANGYIRPEGSIVGGHAILARGVSRLRKDVTLRNSWGTDYGFNGGDCRITWDDLAVVLAQDGEACVPVGRLP